MNLYYSDGIDAVSDAEVFSALMFYSGCTTLKRSTILYIEIADNALRRESGASEMNLRRCSDGYDVSIFWDIDRCGIGLGFLCDNLVQASQRSNNRLGIFSRKMIQ